MRKQKTALITDLDNTLFDWVDLWTKCFSGMLEGIVKISGVSKEQLIPEIRMVHQKHGTSEYSFLIEELPSLQPILKDRPATEVFATPIASYQRLRRKHLRLYATVAETLLRIRGRGTRLIGYTESMAFYSNYRVRRLGLDGVLDHVFCPEDHVLREGISSKDVRKYPTRHYELKYSKQHYTPKGSTKPDTQVLNSIVNNLGLNKVHCVYVGDNLMKDRESLRSVAMALDSGIDDVWAKYGQAHKREEYKLLQDVTHWTEGEVQNEQRITARVDVNPMALDSGIDDVWAKYGQAHKREEYKLLQDVTHWTEGEVQNEQRITARVDVNPSYTLETSFSEILDMFEFVLILCDPVIDKVVSFSERFLMCCYGRPSAN